MLPPPSRDAQNRADMPASSAPKERIRFATGKRGEGSWHLPVPNEALRRNWRHPDRLWVRLTRFGLGSLALVTFVSNIIRALTGATSNDVWQVVWQFTNQTTLLFGIVALTGALVRSEKLPSWWDALRGCAAFAFVMTGLIYQVLVAEPGELFRWDVSWQNIVQHRLLPVVALIGWMTVFMRIRGTQFRWALWLFFPLAFLIASWLRGPVVDWYPYGFMDPSKPGGWGQVLSTLMFPVIPVFVLIAFVVQVAGDALAYVIPRLRIIGEIAAAEAVAANESSASAASASTTDPFVHASEDRPAPPRDPA